MNKQLIAILLILTFLPLQINPAQAVATPILEVSADDIYLKSGQINKIKVNVKNTGDFSVFDVESILTSQNPGISILSNTQKVYNEIMEETTVSFYPLLYVEQSLQLGAYPLSLELLYRRFGEAQDTSIVIPLTVIVDQVFIPRIKYKGAEGESFGAGEETNVSYTFQSNWDENIYDLQLTLSSSSPSITIVDGINTNITKLSPNEELTIKPTIQVLQGTPLGIHSLPVSVSYTDSNEYRYFQKFVVPINIDATTNNDKTILTVKTVRVLSESVQPGDIFTVEFDIECTGAEAYNVISKLSINLIVGLNTITPTAVSIGDFNPETLKMVSYDILADGNVEAGQYPLTVTLSYIDSLGIQNEITETITILVESIIDFQLLDVSTSSAKVGETNELEADLLLIGTDNIQFVKIELNEDNVFKSVSGSNEYIGAVDPDSPIPFDIDFKVDENTEPRTYQMKIDIKYHDHLNKEHETQLEIPITIEKATQQDQATQRGGFWSWLRRLFGLN